MKKELLIKQASINVFLFSIAATNKRGIPFECFNNDLKDRDLCLGELFYAKISDEINDGVKITFEYEDNGRLNNRVFYNRRVYKSIKYDSFQVMFVFEGDNISDPLEV